jgi:hypothetical protein
MSELRAMANLLADQLADRLDRVVVEAHAPVWRGDDVVCGVHWRRNVRWPCPDRVAAWDRMVARADRRQG